MLRKHIWSRKWIRSECWVHVISCYIYRSIKLGKQDVNFSLRSIQLDGEKNSPKLMRKSHFAAFHMCYSTAISRIYGIKMADLYNGICQPLLQIKPLLKQMASLGTDVDKVACISIAVRKALLFV